MNNMKKSNYVVATIFACIGGLIIYFSLQLKGKTISGDPGAGFWPLILGAFLVVLSILLAITTSINKEKEENKEVVLDQIGNMIVYKVMLLVVVFCGVLYLLGFYIAGLLFIPVLMVLIGIKEKKVILLTTVSILVSVYLLFTLILKTPLPGPIFMR